MVYFKAIMKNKHLEIIEIVFSKSKKKGEYMMLSEY